MIGIYKILCIPTEKVYIGQSTDIEKRWKDHIIRLKKKKHDNKYLQNAWQKYGATNFNFSIIEECPKDFKVLNNREVYWIEKYHALERSHGFNIAAGGGNGYTLSGMSESERKAVYEKVGATRREKYSGANNPNFGKPMSEEQKRKISKKLSGEGNYFYGKKRPDHSAKMFGANNPRARPVFCITTEQPFACAKDAEKYARVTNSNILKCCRGTQKSAGKTIDGRPLIWAFA